MPTPTSVAKCVVAGRVDSGQRDNVGQQTSEAITTSWNCFEGVMVELPKQLTSTAPHRLIVDVANPERWLALLTHDCTDKGKPVVRQGRKALNLHCESMEMV